MDVSSRGDEAIGACSTCSKRCSYLEKFAKNYLMQRMQMMQRSELVLEDRYGIDAKR